MIKKITKNELKLGMYIHDLNCGWMNHSFFKKSFMLRKEADLKTILAAPNDDIYIDTLKGMDALSQPEGEDLGQPSGIEPILGRDRVVPPPDRTGFREERGLARQIKHEANVVIRALLTDVRMGRQVRPERLRPIVTRITDSILRNPGTLVSLCRIRETDSCHRRLFLELDQRPGVGAVGGYGAVDGRILPTAFGRVDSAPLGVAGHGDLIGAAALRGIPGEIERQFQRSLSGQLKKIGPGNQHKEIPGIWVGFQYGAAGAGPYRE